jgi:type IV pilus assembly protein PilN
MRITVNLATRPFIELRPLYARLRLSAAALTLAAVAFGAALHFLNAKAREAEAQMNALKTKTQGYQQLRQRNEARMRQPQNMAVLERSRFLNALFAKKSFSWTAVMMDLERVLPAGVQVTSIEPAATKSGEVNIRLRVSGERDRAVELVRNLEKSQRFISPRLANESSQVQEGSATGASTAPGAVEFDIYSGYNPLPQATAADIKNQSNEHQQSTHSTVPSGSSRAGAPKGSPSTRSQTGARQ